MCIVGNGKEGKRRITSLDIKAWKCTKGGTKRFYKKNWLGEGHMILPFCPVIYCPSPWLPFYRINMKYEPNISSDN